MPSTPSALASIRNRLAAGKHLPVAVAVPIAVGISLAGTAEAQTSVTLSTSQTTTFYPASSATNILITSTGGVNDTGALPVNRLLTGVYITSNQGWSMTNNGTISISEVGIFLQADGVYAHNSGTLINTGLINAPNSNAGFYVGNSGSNKTTITNTGTIIGNYFGVGIKHAADLVNGSPSDGSALIKNNSTDFPTNAAVYVSAFNNTNTITNYGTIMGAAHGISAGGTTTITNYGTITAGTGYNAINLRNALTGSAVILKDGSQVVGNVKAASTGLLPPLTLEGSGTITGTISGFSSLTMSGTDWSLNGSSTVTNATLQSGILRIASTLNSAIQLSSGATLAGTGTVVGNLTVPSGATILPGSSGTPGTLTVNGAYVQSNGATLTVHTTPSASSKLAVTGSATLGGALSVVSSGSGYSDPTQFTILTAGSVSGTFNSVTESDPTLTPTVTYDTANNQVLLTLTETVSPPVVLPPVVVPPPVVAPPPVVVSPPPIVGVIDTSRTNFTNNDGAVQASTVTFDGGTLKPASPLSLTQAVIVTDNNGNIIPAGSGVTLSGAISGSGALTVKGPGSVVVGGAVTNSGGIAVAGGGSLTVASGGQVAVPLTLTGGSNANIGGTVSGIVSVGGGSGVTVANGGILTGGLNLANGSATVGGIVAAPVSVSSGGSMTIVQGGGVGGVVSVSGGSLTVAQNGAVNGNVTVTDGGSVNVDGAIMAPVSVQNATLTIDSVGSTGAITVSDGGVAKVNGTALGTVTVGTGSTLSGGGAIVGATTVAGTLSPGNSPGMLTARSAVTLTGTGIYRAEIDGPTAGTGAGHHDQLIVQGSTFTAAGTLEPVLRGIAGSATNSYTATLGQSFTIATASGGVLGGFDAVAQPAEGLAAGTRLDALYDTTAVRLVVTPSRYAALGGTRNQRAAGTAVDILRPVAGTRLSGTMAPLFSGLYGLNAAGTAGALDQLSGKLHADTLAADRTNRRLFGRAIEDRLSALRDGAAGGGLRFSGVSGNAMAAGTSAGDAGAGGVWGQPLAAYGRTGSDGNAAGTNERIGGFVVGADHSYDDSLSAGVALGFLRNQLSSRNGLGKGRADSYQATLYGSWNLGGPYVDGAVGYGYSHYDTQRIISFGGFAQGADAKADGHDLSAELAAGHRMTAGILGDAVWIEPRIGLRLDRITRGSFSEDGGVAALGVDASAWTTLRSSIGLRTGTSVTLGGWTFQPSASLAWAHDFGDVTASTANRLAGVAFTADASRPGRDVALIGAGVSFQLDDRMSASVSVRDELRIRGNTVSVAAGLKWRL